MKRCNCYSYNLGIGVNQESILKPPSFISEKETICVDSCIAHVIKHLWENKIVTMGSCCGHNMEPPSIVLQAGCGQHNGRHVRALIKEVDDREFELMSWNLIRI